MRTIRFELAEPTKLLNQVLRMHWSKRRKYQQKLAWEVKIAMGGQRPSAPFTRARVRIERHSIGRPDVDGMIGGYKHLIDCLLPPGDPYRSNGRLVSRHPCGLGVIADDNPDCLEHDYPRPFVVKDPKAQKTVVVIEELPVSE